MNLLKETIDIIESSSLIIEDIIFIGSEKTGHECTWDEFKILADKYYDDGFGAQEVAYDLIFVFKDGTKMVRSEYDGSEIWEIQKPFIRPKQKFSIKSLFARVGWDSVQECTGDFNEL